METPKHYKNGLPLLPHQEAEAGQALVGSNLLEGVIMAAAYTQDIDLETWKLERSLERNGYEFTVFSVGPVKRLLYQPCKK